jgi:hypothetical protein
MVALVLLLSLAFAALAAARPAIDGRSFGGFLTHHVICAATGGCHQDERAVELAYGEDVAGALRENAPNLVYEPGERELPVDWRHCRQPRCATAPDDPGLDVHVGDGHLGGGRRVRATAFTRVLRRHGRLYLQYWLYYPDSTSTVGNVAGAWNTVSRAVTTREDDPKQSYPGYHDDDWESYQVRIDRSGQAFARASAHHGYQGCKQRECQNQWTRQTGWTRVSRGSHAGHIPLRRHGGAITFSLHDGFGTTPRSYSPTYPGVDLHERTTTAAGLRLLPVESLPSDMTFAISAPWRKEVYRDPASNSTG